MTFGSGSSGCLGHGNYDDNSNVSEPPSYDRRMCTCVHVCMCTYIRTCVVESIIALLQPRIIESIIGYETVDVACGAHHVLALMSEGEVFAWGKGEGG